MLLKNISLILDFDEVIDALRFLVSLCFRFVLLNALSKQRGEINK